MNKISICTVCMNRLFHLRETLPINIRENSHYPNIEFVLLDYNSSDGLENWIKARMMPHLESGLLKYYRTNDPMHFSITHSKNMVSNLATGDIICMVDADNYAGQDYASWVNAVFEEHGKNTFTTTIENHYTPYRDQGGKLAFHRDAFQTIQGYDESLVGYGLDDVDFTNRLELEGGKRILIDHKAHLRFISHSNFERVCNYYLINHLADIYQLEHQDGHTTPPFLFPLENEAFLPMAHQQAFLYLLSDGIFLDATYHFDESSKTKQFLTYGGWTIDKQSIKQGNYQWSTDGLLLTETDGTSTHYARLNEATLSYTAEAPTYAWKKLRDEDELFKELSLLSYECMNRLKFKENTQNRTTINLEGWGKGTAYLNFNSHHPISTIAHATIPA